MTAKVARAVAGFAACIGAAAVVAWLLIAPVSAQVLPTTTSSLLPSSTTSTSRPPRPRPSSTSTTANTSTSVTRSKSTTSSSSSSSTEVFTIPPPVSLAPDEQPATTPEGQGDLSKVFPILSGIGFAVAAIVVGVQYFRTR